MLHTCFISHKNTNEYNSRKKFIREKLQDRLIDNSLYIPIDSENADYVMQQIREKYLSRKSTVTIFLIGTRSSESLGHEEQQYIKRELQASLYNGEGNTRNGILGVVLPEMYDRIYLGNDICSICNQNHNYINLNDETVIKEFHVNYFLDKSEDQCGYSEEDRYCVLVKWEDFIESPDFYIDQSFEKRVQPIASKVIVYPK